MRIRGWVGGFLLTALLCSQAPAAAEGLDAATLEAQVRAAKRVATEGARDPAMRGAVEVPSALNPSKTGRVRPAMAEESEAIPFNLRINDFTGDASIATQSETSVASWGDYVLVAWNDGQGSFTGGAYQGYGYSVDGGLTFVDGGDPPRPPGLPAFRWTSDPVVTVNPRTGTFYYCAMANSDATHNAIAVGRGSFAGGTFVWQDVQVAREGNNTNTYLDKPWIVADSSGTGDWVYIANTTYTVSGNRIDLMRSSNGGDTWGNPGQISNNADNGNVQAARPVVGPAGQLHVVWWAIGQGVPEDFIRCRTSLNHGQSFASEVTAASHISNFGTGGPGFNRDRGIHWPSVAVDRTTGAHRGRLYLTWTESFNFQDDALGTGLPRVEVEPNAFWLTGTTFVPGDVLRGSSASVAPVDLDFWRFDLAAGQSLVVWADSLPAGQTYELRVFGPGADSTESLAFGGDFTPGSFVNQAYYTFTAPVAATYGLRMGPIDAASVTGGYRIRTGIGVRGSERGRDQRDVFVSSSDNATTWSTPVRVNDDPVGFDDFLSEVAVGADGFPYVTWYDYRGHPVGAHADLYIARSDDGGVTWPLNARLTSVTTRWQGTGSNLAPNMGDYHGLTSDERWLRSAWGDGRDGSADAYGTRLDLPQIIACAPDTVAPPGFTVAMSWPVSNPNPRFANGYNLSVISGRAWTVTGPATLALDSESGGQVTFQVVVPDSAAPGSNPITLTVTNASGAIVRSCSAHLLVGGSVSVGEGASDFGLESVLPNPAHGAMTIGYTLGRTESATLRIYGISGQLVRTLADGSQPAGRHDATWDGLDLRGRPVAAGVYFARLATATRTATARLVRMR